MVAKKNERLKNSYYKRCWIYRLYLAITLSKENKVTVIDDLSTGSIKNIRDFIDSNAIGLVKGSITDLDLVQKTFEDVDYVFHEAAIASVPRSIKDPVTSNYANVKWYS